MPLLYGWLSYPRRRVNKYTLCVVFILEKKSKYSALTHKFTSGNEITFGQPQYCTSIFCSKFLLVIECILYRTLYILLQLYLVRQIQKIADKIYSEIKLFVESFLNAAMPIIFYFCHHHSSPTVIIIFCFILTCCTFVFKFQYQVFKLKKKIS